MKALFSLCFILLSYQLSAQKILYTNNIGEDNRDIRFEIIGKIENNYLIYKNVRWKHVLAVYGEDMNLKDNMRLSFIPDKTFNVDLVAYPDFFYMIYQYQKNNVIWCKAVKINGMGKKLSEPVTLDTSRTGLIADKKIYNTVHSEDKKFILVYKMQRKNDRLILVTKLYNKELAMQDSTREILTFNERKDIYSDLVVDNKGNFLFAKSYKPAWMDFVTDLSLIVREPKSSASQAILIPLQSKYIDEMKIKVDNLNQKYILNTLFATEKTGSVKGLFTAIIESDKLQNMRTAFNLFSDSVRAKINSNGQYSRAFDNLFLRNTYVKKDGSFIITGESQFYQQTNIPNSMMRRYNSIYNSPYSSNYDYYINSPSYYPYYRPYSFTVNTRHYYDDILVLNIDSSLNLNWSTVIHKKQSDDDNDNFLSFATVNSGSEIHFLFNDGKKNQVINNHSILPNGTVKRYATLKSYETGYEFMPKLSRQVGARQIIVPCLYRSSITFAKIDFSE